MRPTSFLALALLVLGAHGARAQCPDGNPPPCAGVRRASPRRAIPDSAARARSFLMLPFRNVARSEAQEWLVAGSPLMLADAFGQFRDLSIVPDEQLLAARRRLSLPAEVPPGGPQLRRLAEETGGWTAITGNIVATGGRLRFTAQATDAASGRLLARASANIPADADVRGAFDSLALQLLQVTGLEGQASDIASLSTRSLDAYRAYVRGMALLHQSAFKRAGDAFAEATRLDSTFAMAWARRALASMAWNLAETVNPLSQVYRSSARAAALAPRLPPLLAAKVRIQSAFFRGQMSQAQLVAESLYAAHPDDLDVLEFLSTFELFDPTMDTTSAASRLRASPTRAISLARELLERDPGRRYVYSAIGYIYGLAGGMWGGMLSGSRGHASSFAMLLMGSDHAFVPVLRDSFVVMTLEDFAALPAGEQTALRRRAADAGAQWMQRWLAAGPEDGEAHLWASRFAELQDSFPQALRHAVTAESLGVESGMEGLSGRRIMLLLRSGRVDDAGRLADSVAARGALRPSFVPFIDRGYAFGIAALLMTGRLARVGDVAAVNAGRDDACPMLAQIFLPGTTASLPDSIVAAVRDSIGRHVDEVQDRPVLWRCLRQIAGR